MTVVTNCELCRGEGGRAVWRDDRLRVIGVDDAAFPAFYRVVWNAHVAEWTDLAPADRGHCLDVVATVETALRRALRPTKINLASLGNMTPHLHWHVIARFDWDSHFPQAVWGTAQRAADATHLDALRARLPGLDAAIAAALRTPGVH